jgi:hypothetical protein
MKILLIAPKIDDKENKFLIEAQKNRSTFPLLGLPYIAALTPTHI